MRRHGADEAELLGTIVEMAEVYGINVNIEIHGYFTTKPDMVREDAGLCRKPYFGLNFDTGNSFIAGQDPVEFCRRFVTGSTTCTSRTCRRAWPRRLRGKETGIAISHCAIGDGVNADNITKDPRDA